MPESMDKLNADIFEFSQEVYYLNQMINLIGFSYRTLYQERQEQPYSRTKLRSEFVQKKGTAGKKTKLELEDYLRNDLVNNYINKFKFNYNLGNFHFVCGVDETEENITTGNLDIKVLFPTSGYFENIPYFAIECKRIDKSKHKKNYYVDHGINRFITRQYYPKTDFSVAGLICFMETEDDKHIESSEDIVKDINSDLNKRYTRNVKSSLQDKSSDYKYITGLNIFDSTFLRTDDTDIDVYHIYLDYYALIKA